MAQIIVGMLFFASVVTFIYWFQWFFMGEMLRFRYVLLGLVILYAFCLIVWMNAVFWAKYAQTIKAAVEWFIGAIFFTPLWT